MRVYNRSFDVEQKDLRTILQFLVDDYADKQDHYVWSATRLGGWVNNAQSETQDKIQLWFNSIDELVGFTISENGTAEFYVMVRRGHELLYGEIIDWVKDNWKNKEGVLSTQADENQHILMRVLEKAGFKKGGIVQVSRQYDLLSMDLSVTSLPDGFVIKDMLACKNIYGIRLLRNNAFRGVNEVSGSDIKRENLRDNDPYYLPHFDVYAESKNNQIVSGCIGLVDYKNNYAEIEVVATHSEYRRRGLAQAVITECMRRLRDDGVKYAYISGYSEAAINLYGKFKFLKIRNWFGFSM